jgi:hypothetical protein
MLEQSKAVDLFVFELVNSQAGMSRPLDLFVTLLADNDIAKGIPVFLVWWGLWFWRTEGLALRRAKLLATLAVSIAGIFVGRLLAVTLPSDSARSTTAAWKSRCRST